MVRDGLSGSALRREGGIEQLEARTLMSAALPELPPDSEYVQWGQSKIASVAGSYILTFDNQLNEAQVQSVAREAASRMGVNLQSVRTLARGWHAEIKVDRAISRSAAAATSDAVAELSSIEPNALKQTLRVPNDPRLTDQYSYVNIGQNIQGAPGITDADIDADIAWDTSIGSPNTIVAIIDTGIDLTHPDLITNLWVNPGEIAGDGIDNDGNGFVDDINGFDFGELDGSPQDVAGHGTAVAGVVGAQGNNGIGVTGVNWEVSLMGMKIADAQGRLSTAAIVGAHDYLTMMRGRGFNIVVSNNSYGAFAPEFYLDTEGSQAERAAIERWLASGGIFVAAAGNSGTDNDSELSNYPASYNIPGVISVAASDNRDGIAGFSAFGAETVDLAAPGVAVLTTFVGGTYGFINGTSFSAPTVAGAVALLKTIKPNASAVEVREALINSADQLPAFQGRTRSGGRLNLARAIEIINIDGPVVRSVLPGPITTQNTSTGAPLTSLSVSFSKDIAASSLTTVPATLLFAGADGVFGSGDDQNVPVANIALVSGSARDVVVNLNLAGFVGGRLPVGSYRLTLLAQSTPTVRAIRDTNGSFLNGNSTGGDNEVYDFRVVAPTGDNEPNDDLSIATLVPFDASGSATFSGASIGNGIFGPRDVDLYRINLARGGLITAEITARRLASGSTLDSVLRLFNAQGVEIASNDQFFQEDSFIDFFVSTGGTYYIGVSGFGNSAYNPFVGNSGSAQSVGAYTLRIATQLAQDDVQSFTGFVPSPAPAPGVDPFLTFDAPAGLTTLIPPNAPVDTQGVTTSFIQINDTREILDVNLRLRLNHTFVGDLTISLIGPTGLEVILVNRRGGSGDNFFNVIFDDEATFRIVNLIPGQNPPTASYQPEQALGGFDGTRANGRWTLRIDDQGSGNTGRLLNWGLEFTFQNDIFGPFESNDTLATANNVSEFIGSGVATRDAFIGDGGFGTLDRDIYRINVNAGSTLSAVATPTATSGTPTLRTLLRLFSESGTQILITNPSLGAASSITNYVFPSGGIFFIAVSEAANLAYNPQSVSDGSGVPAQTTGAYRLQITVAPGVSDPGTLLASDRLNVGFGSTGSFSSGTTGIRFASNAGNVEFLPGAETGFTSIFAYGASGSSFANTADAGTAQPFSLTNVSDPANNRITSKTLFRGMRIERTISMPTSYATLGGDRAFYAIDLYLTNTTSSTLTNVSFLEAFNPDQGLSLGSSGPNGRITENDVVNGRLVRGAFRTNVFPQGMTIAIGAPQSETRARGTVLAPGGVPRDPAQIAQNPAFDPDGAASDSVLALAFDFGAVGIGQTVAVRYFVFVGTSTDAVDQMYAAVNNGTGTGHLAANPAAPANETLSNGVNIPQLPFKVVYPEGFFGDRIYTFVPISNPNDQAARVFAVARYEFGDRDQVLAELNVAANSRSGFTIVTPELFAQGGQLIRNGTPYAIEIRSDRPVAATFSHYDLNLSGGFRASVGESFTSQTSQQWSFADVRKGPGVSEFILWYNTTNTTDKVTVTFYPAGGGSPLFTTFDIEGFRRGGVSIPDVRVQRNITDTPFALPEGTYGVVVSSPLPLVASLSHYDSTNRTAEGEIGAPGSGATTGAIPEGQRGLNGATETLNVLNSTNAATTVNFSFLFDNGSAYRAVLDVPSRSNRQLDVSTLPNFQTGRPYSVFFESAQPVTVNSRVSANNGFPGWSLSSVSANNAFSWWGFGEGIRPGDTNTVAPGVREYLRLYNPNATDTVVEITIAYDGTPGSESFRRVLPARRVTEFNLDQFITGNRRLTDQFFSTTVKTADPIVAYMAHYDRAFPGGFGTLGTPLGRFAPVT
jgi:subtilisin-like proprotein convertase family protein